MGVGEIGLYEVPQGSWHRNRALFCCGQGKQSLTTSKHKDFFFGTSCRISIILRTLPTPLRTVSPEDELLGQQSCKIHRMVCFAFFLADRSLRTDHLPVESRCSAVIKMPCAWLKALKSRSPQCQVMFTSTKDEEMSFP